MILLSKSTSWNPPSGCVLWLSGKHCGNVAKLGTWLDQSSNSNHCTLFADAQVTGGTLAVDGIGDYGSINVAASTNITTLSMCAWVKINGGDTYKEIIQKNALYMLRARPSMIEVFIWHSDLSRVANYRTSSSAYSNGVWTHWAFIGNYTSGAIYKNGIFRTTTKTTYNWPGSGTLAIPIVIGGTESGGENLNGNIDQAMIFNRAISTTELGYIYNNVYKHI